MTLSAIAPVYVVGAGPSGLAAALRLHEAGIPTVVLESRDRVGGQLHTVKQDGFLMEAGTTILPEAYSSVMGLVRDLDMTDELAPANSLMGFMRGSEMHYLRADRLAIDAARTKLLSLRAKLAVSRLVWDSFKQRKLLSYEDLSIAAAYDVETPEDYCRRRGMAGELYDYLIEPTVRGGAGVPGNMISVVEFFFLWQKVLGTKLFAFRDGYESFPQRMAAKLPDVRLGCSAVDVVEDADGVTVTYEGPSGRHVERGSGAIISAMGNRVPDLVPQLDPERARFLRDLSYTATMSINIGLRRTPECPASFVVVPRPVSEGMFALILEHNKVAGRAPKGKGLVSAFMMNQWAVDHMEASDEDIVAEILADAEKVIPGISADVEFTRVNRWYPVLVYSHPGLYKKMARFHATRSLTSRIHLAGSYNSSGNVNTATTAGERAARELLNALRGKETFALQESR
ncbi:NAD(P)/FAD-dependent oxidoreductase [Mycolicibacterium neoaurum]|uniref:protoporphyrinogen/coproporphyrinogen oxidase n=1 Tax=Mycolicibacterium neoaurum TaxID=1795 RepID=UPI002671454A|nr:NAD(P)/FAD-dependent oxidoreductase [Mycolicibacterium neoaurum]MDO3398985.1 NAD(P)/FAD-dependent oxidoreductase [Mycolicibacterium neoaurum]